MKEDAVSLPTNPPIPVITIDPQDMPRCSECGGEVAIVAGCKRDYLLCLDCRWTGTEPPAANEASLNSR